MCVWKWGFATTGCDAMRNANLNYLSCYPEGCAATSFVPCQRNTQGTLSKLEEYPFPRKITVTSKSPVGDISVVTLIRTDTTLDHSQKAEKVCCTAGVALVQISAAKERSCSLPQRMFSLLRVAAVPAMCSGPQ